MDKSDGQNKYGYLDQLSTACLEEILRGDIESSEGGDEDMILYILEVIEKREKKKPTGLLCDVDEAWQEFQEHYMDLDDPLYPLSSTNNCSDRETSSKSADVRVVASPADRQHSSAHRVSRTFLKRLIPIAATIAVLLAGMVTAQAVGMDVFGALAKWTDETFRFVSLNRYEESNTTPEQAEISPEAQALRDAFQAALDECEITAAIVPTWLPEAYSIVDKVKIASTTYVDRISCKCQAASGEYFVITVQKYHQTVLPEVMLSEKDGNPVERYLANGRLFYIMSNNEKVSAAWSDSESLSLKVSGDISIEILKQFLDSIGG